MKISSDHFRSHKCAIWFTLWGSVTFIYFLRTPNQPLQHLDWSFGLACLVISGVSILMVFRHRQKQRKLERMVQERTASLDALLKKHQNITRSLPVGFAVYQNGAVSEMNPLMEKWFGDADLLHDQITCLLEKTAHPEQPSQPVLSLQTRIGRRQMRCIMKDFPTDEAPDGRILLFEDWTEQLRAEQALRDKTIELERHFASSTDLLSISTLDGTFLDLNPQWEKNLGHAIAEMTGQRWQDFVVQADQEKARQLLQRLCDGQSVENFPLRFADKTGEVIWLEWQGVRQGHLIHANVRNITERMQAEEKNRKMREQIARSQKMESIGRLAGGIAHDFNNSLQVIIGNAQLALKNPALSEETQAQITDLLKAAERSAQLTRQLLGFAMKQHVRAEHTCLNRQLKAMAPMFHTVLGDRIRLEWQLDDQLDMVKIDHGQLKQICVNLLENARNAMPNGGTVTLSTRNHFLFKSDMKSLLIPCPAGEYVSLSVRDNGPGIDPSVQTTLFEPFVSTQDPSRGSGLGLATVYGILQQNKGAIRVQSSEAGSCFEMFLAKEEAPVPQRNPPSKTSCPRNKVLLVDDNPQVLKLTGMVLHELHYTCHACHTANESLRVLAEQPDIGILITDMMMPEMSGQDLYEKALEVRPDLKCIFMSGYSSEVVPSALLDTGNCAFLNKPFSVNGIREVLDTLVTT